MAGVTLEERLDKIRSPNLESQKKTAVVLKAVEATFEQAKSDGSPVSYFAALLATLQQTAGDGAQDGLQSSIVYLLDIVTPFTPAELLRDKFSQILSILAPVLMKAGAEAPLLRASVGFLESLLVAQNFAAWQQPATDMSPRMAVGGILQLSVDPRPKVRKRALEALRKVLDSPPAGPTLDHPASIMCAETAMASLKELAQRARQSRKDSKRGGGNTAAAAAAGPQPMHDPDLIHALQLVRTIAASGNGWPSQSIEPLCELLLEIARTGNDHMSVAVLEVFEMIFQGMTGEISSAKLTRLLEIISELRPAPNDTQLLPPWIAILSRGYDVSAQVEPEETFYRLPELFSMVVAYLESPSDNIRVSAAECLVSFLANCVPAQAVLEPSMYDEKVLSKLGKLAEGFLGVRYQAAAAEVFMVIGAMYDALRWQADPFLREVTKILGELRGSDSFDGKKEVDKLLGAAIRAMGPGAVLQILPHNLTRPTAEAPGRAWLLPLFREYTTNTTLETFKTEFVPLSNAMFQRVLDHAEAEKTLEIKIFETVVQQVWSSFPGFCDLPLDVTTAFDNGFAELLANLLYTQVELRFDVCRALKTLIESNQGIAALGEDQPDDLYVQCRVSKAQAKANLAYLGGFAGQYLAVLFNVYGKSLAQSRGPILQTINAFLSITPETDLVSSFDEACKLLVAELQAAAAAEAAAAKTKKTVTAMVAEFAAQKAAAAAGEQIPSMSHTLLDLITAMALHLPRECYSALFEIAALAIVRDNDPQLQKKAYKLIPRLAESEVGKVALAERNAELQTLLLASADKVSAPARRERLAAMESLMPILPDDALHFIPSVLSEVVISCKEQNERARTSAFDLLVVMGERMAAAGGSGVKIDISKVPDMASDAPAAEASIEEFFTMVSAGLAGSTPHMISASITAISRILYEFHEQLDPVALSELVQTVDLFLESNNREVVRSVLGFVKVCAISLPMEMMRGKLASLIPQLMVWSHEHKGHMRSKVKLILERMVRRFGYETVYKHCPEADRKLIVNIRKTKERNKRKKAAAAEEGGEGGGHKAGGSDDEGDEGGEAARKARKARFDSGFDEALYSGSDDDGDSNSDGGDADSDSDDGLMGRKKKRGAKGGQAFIMEEGDEPLDLLDRKAMGRISSTRPIKMRKPTQGKAKFNVDGKLILTDGAGEGHGGDDGMEIDGNDDGAGAGSGVNAYMAAVSGKDVPKRGFRGKLKWSNKKGKDDGDEDGDEAMGEADAAAIKGQLGKGQGRDRPAFRGVSRGGGRGASRGGSRGGSGAGRGRGGFGARRPLGEEKRRAGGGGGASPGRVGKSFAKRR